MDNEVLDFLISSLGFLLIYCCAITYMYIKEVKQYKEDNEFMIKEIKSNTYVMKLMIQKIKEKEN